ncbi:hypothetical protein SLA2020_287260 [Shorea laevis]
MKVLSWNCWGAVSNEFKRNAMEIIREHNPGIFIIMETKLTSDRVVKVARSLGLPKWKLVDADSYTGGIWILWDDSRFVVDILNKGSQVIHALVKVCSHPNFVDFEWYLSAVHVINDPWLAIGDFNDITNQSEKFGGNPCPFYRIQAYTNCMSYCNLLDLGLMDPS